MAFFHLNPPWKRPEKNLGGWRWWTKKGLGNHLDEYLDMWSGFGSHEKDNDMKLWMATSSRNFAEARFSSSKFVHRSGDYTSRSTEKGVASIHLHMCAYNINALWYTKHSIPYQIFKPGTHVHFTFQKFFIILKLQKFLKLNGHHVILKMQRRIVSLSRLCRRRALQEGSRTLRTRSSRTCQGISGHQNMIII